jgi:hypothetical protein
MFFDPDRGFGRYGPLGDLAIGEAVGCELGDGQL